MTEALATLNRDERIDALEQSLLDQAPPVRCPVEHGFTPGIYSREIFMPAGTLVTSKIHKIEHPYVVLSGTVHVSTADGVQTIEGPYVGRTMPGTRRVLYCETDVRWITFHPNADDSQDMEVIEARLIERRELPDGTTAFDRYAALLEEQEQRQLSEEGGA